MSILESYILVGGAQFLQLHSQRVAHIFELVVGNIKEKGYAAVLPAIDLLIQVRGNDVLSVCQSSIVLAVR
jgi:hypothetical protein